MITRSIRVDSTVQTVVLRLPCRTSRRQAVTGLVLLASLATGRLAWAQAPPSDAKDAPDLTVDAHQYPEDDAVILRWEQYWMLQEDGTVRRRDHQWIKLLNSRPIRALGDPRIDFCEGQDRLVIHAARTHLPDGEVLPVPEYSLNEAGPDDVAGWPEYVGWKQTVVSFSGIRDNAVLELDYEVITAPGVLPWVEADLRLHEDYPTVERGVHVTVPDKTGLLWKIDGLSPAPQPAKQSASGATMYSWSFRGLPGSPAEPQSPPWQRRCGRLRFTTCPSEEAWVSAILDRVNRVAKPDDAIRKFAEDATQDESAASDKVRALTRKLGDSFNFVDSPKTLRSLQCRDAAVVFGSNYGNPLEAAAVCLGAIRSLGFDAWPAVAADAVLWDEKVPTTSAFAGVAVVVDAPQGPIYVHPQRGVLQNPGTWGKRWLLSLDDAGNLRKSYVSMRGENAPSELAVSGKVTLASDGKADGELRIQLTGAFYDPLKLESSSGQESHVKALVGRMLTDFGVASQSVATLSDEQFKATAKVTANDAVKSLGKRRVLRFGDGPAFLPDIAMPLPRSYRRTDVQLAGAFRESIDVTIELPEGWSAGVIPASLSAVEGSWGTVEQIVQPRDRSVRLRRSITVNRDTLDPQSFAGLRDAINRLRADASLVLICGP